MKDTCFLFLDSYENKDGNTCAVDILECMK